MKPDYKNWVPRGLLFLLGGMAIICLMYRVRHGGRGDGGRTAHRARRSLWRSVFAVCRPDGHICKYVLRLFVRELLNSIGRGSCQSFARSRMRIRYRIRV